MKSLSLLGAALLVASWPASPAQAECVDRAEARLDTFFVAPTEDTTPVRAVLKGEAFVIPRNYYAYPSLECGPAGITGFWLRATLPDMLPLTAETHDRLWGRTAALEDDYVNVVLSDSYTTDLAGFLETFRREEQPGRKAEPIQGLDSLVSGSTGPNRRPTWEVYFAPNRENPGIVASCMPIEPNKDPRCRLLHRFKHLTVRTSVARKKMHSWQQITASVRELLAGLQSAAAQGREVPYVE